MDVNQIAVDFGIEVVGLIATSLWGAFKASAWFGRRRERRYMRCLEAIRAAVEGTYQTFVRDIKAASADGKLTKAERHEALNRARVAAIGIARSDGLDLIKTVVTEMIPMLIERFIREARAVKKAGVS